MSGVKVYLNKSYQKRNGECAIYIMVHIDYKSLKFPTGVNCHPDSWNEKNYRIKGTSKKVKDDNLIIQKSLALINDIFVRYRLQNINLTAELLQKEWKNPARRIDFYKFFQEAIEERKVELAYQTYKNHNTIINKLKEFRPKLAFSEINADLLEQYKRWLKTRKKNDINTIHSAMKVLKAYIRIAIKKQIITNNPFDNVRSVEVESDRVFLSVEELNKMWEVYGNKKLSESNERVLRHFLFMCFTGLRISDFKAIKKYNVVNNILIYYPEKTARIKKIPVKVPLTKYALQLISDENSETEFLFNPISEQNMNVYIKEIAKKAGIIKNLSNHSARHTFATV